MGRSIDLMEELAYDTDNAIDMTRRGYLYLTAEQSTFEEMASTAQGLAAGGAVPRCETHADGSAYERSHVGSLSMAQLAAATGREEGASEPLTPLAGIDLIAGREAVQELWPYVDDRVVGALHARRAGWVSAQQMGTCLMQKAKDAGVAFVSGAVVGVEAEAGQVSGVRWVPAAPADGRPSLPMDGGEGGVVTATPHFINAAGPMLNEVHALLPGDDCTAAAVGALAHNELAPTGRALPLRNHVHSKVIFRDTESVVPRDAPMMIWTDAQDIGEEFRSGESQSFALMHTPVDPRLRFSLRLRPTAHRLGVAPISSALSQRCGLAGR